MEIIYGPYVNKAHGSRKYVKIQDNHGQIKTCTYARYLMEQHLGYELESGLEVDHKNDDIIDDRIENLQVLTYVENRQKQANKLHPNGIEFYESTCIVCKKLYRKEARFIRSNIAHGRPSKCCGLKCASEYRYHKDRYNGLD